MRRYLIILAACLVVVACVGALNAQPAPKILRYSVSPRYVQSDYYGLAKSTVRVSVRSQGGYLVGVGLESEHIERTSTRPADDAHTQTFYFDQLRVGVYDVTIALLDTHERVVVRVGAGTVTVLE